MGAGFPLLALGLTGVAFLLMWLLKRVEERLFPPEAEAPPPASEEA